MPSVVLANQATEHTSKQRQTISIDLDVAGVSLVVIQVQQGALPLVGAGFLCATHNGLANFFW